MSTVIFALAVVLGIWYLIVLTFQVMGVTQIFRYYSSKPKPAVSPTLKLDEVPHITVIRPVKGLEPQLYECLAATFQQDYPIEKLTVYFCVDSTHDPAFPVLQRLLADFPKFDTKIFVGEEDFSLRGHGGERRKLGPNPKIRNMSRGYREAKGDIIWVADCNVWMGKGVAGRMVDKLCGYAPDGKRTTPYKFVHQLPIVVDRVEASAGEEARGLLNHVEGHRDDDKVSSTSTSAYNITPRPKNDLLLSTILQRCGGRLEEMFMATAHAKFYTAINTILIAPCIVGKSNMFRKSHLDYLTSGASRYSPGIDYFSENICEDHLIGDLLWRKKVHEEKQGRKFYKHGMVFGDLAIQPMASMSVSEYTARRIRWLRVRKFTVIMATLVEPGTESLLCSAYGAFAVTTLPWFHDMLGVPQTWLTFFLLWLLSVMTWMVVDTFEYAKLHSGAAIELDSDTPSFARPPKGNSRRNFDDWLAAWLGREILAWPTWAWAVLGGATVVWRGKKFRVGLDMRVVEIKPKDPTGTPEVERARSRRGSHEADEAENDVADLSEL